MREVLLWLALFSWMQLLSGGLEQRRTNQLVSSEDTSQHSRKMRLLEFSGQTPWGEEAAEGPDISMGILSNLCLRPLSDCAWSEGLQDLVGRILQQQLHRLFRQTLSVVYVIPYQPLWRNLLEQVGNKIYPDRSQVLDSRSDLKASKVTSKRIRRAGSSYCRQSVNSPVSSSPGNYCLCTLLLLHVDWLHDLSVMNRV